MYLLTQQAHDSHFYYVPDVVGIVFNWGRPVPIVSVSSDGKALPQVFAYQDVVAESVGKASYKPSNITKINGEDTIKFLQKWSQYGAVHDRDALWNNMFYELATVSVGDEGDGTGTFAGSGRGRFVYPGPTTELTFGNGTKRSYENFASVHVNFDGVTDGQSLYDKWFTGTQPGSPTGPNFNAPATPSPIPARTIPAPGYPSPVIRATNNLIGGYYLEDDYSDVAVLSVPTFVEDDRYGKEFSETASKFLAEAKKAGKKKLVIDLSGNRGGTILLGYDLYKQLFPDKIDYGAADRARAFESTQLLFEHLSALSSTVQRDADATSIGLTIMNNAVSTPFNYRSDWDTNFKAFPNWQAKFGPVQSHFDNYTNLWKWNLHDPVNRLLNGNVTIHGTGSLRNYKQTPFAPSDVVVVTDGVCASTCAVFSEIMRTRAGVKYISLGGRPQPGITQAVGGTKGSNNYMWTWIQYLAQYTVNSVRGSQAGSRINDTELHQYYDQTPFIRAATQESMSINFRDAIRETDKSLTPLQFVWEPADCRILYTKNMTTDATAIWKAAADTAWGGKNRCVAGGLKSGARRMMKKKRSLSGEEKRYSKRMAEWRAGLKPEDYPLDVRTGVHVKP